MEAIAALGFACNVIQLVETGCKTASIFRQAYKDGTTKHNSDLKSTTQSLSSFLQEFKKAPSPRLDGEEKELYQLGSKVASTAESLYNLVKPSTEDGPTSTRKKLKSGWRSLRDSGEIKEHEAKLRLYQEALNTVVLVDLRKQFIFSEVQNRQDFDQLGTDLQDFIREQAIVQQREHHETQAIVRHEGVATRADLSTKLSAMTIDNERQAARQQLLQSLRIPDMNKRKTDISYNHEGTFEWILNGKDSFPNDQGSLLDDDVFPLDGKYEGNYRDVVEHDKRNHEEAAVTNFGFVDWLITGDDNYWVCGKAGSGKSTLMRFIIEHESTQSYLNQWAGSQELCTIEAYIWNAGSDFQKSYKGVLATILVQLLEQTNPDIINSLIHSQRLQNRVSITDWHVREIEEQILTLIAHSTRRFCLFIDGLDELEVQQRLEDDEVLLRFIRRISALPNIKSCLSSRPERLFEIFFQDTKTLRLEELNAGDIRRLCKESLEQTVKETRRTLTEAELNDLRYLVHVLVERAGGVFLWAHLVLGQIRRGIRAHDEIAELHRYLDSLPSEITKLYEHMWARNNEDLLEYREEAANFINSVLICEGVHPYTPWRFNVLSVVQLVLMFDQKFQGNHKQLTSSSDLAKACTKFKERISVRSAGLLHVVKVHKHGYSPINDSDMHNDFETLRRSRVQLIHRTALDFLLTEPMGRQICSEASVSRGDLAGRLLLALLQEQSLSSQIVSYAWLVGFVTMLRSHCDSLHSSKIVEILIKYENVWVTSAKKYLVSENADELLPEFLRCMSSTYLRSLRQLVPMDFNAWVFRHGLSSGILNSIEGDSSGLNPEYCAYLLSMFDFWHTNDVDYQFYKLVSLLLQQPRLEWDRIFYFQCTAFYPSSQSLPHEKRVEDHDPDSINHNGTASTSAVRCSVVRALHKLMFDPRGHGWSWKQKKWLQPVLSHMTPAWNHPSPFGTELALVAVRECELSVEWAADFSERNVERIMFLIEFNPKDVLYWCSLRVQTCHIGHEHDDDIECTLTPPDDGWNIVVKAIGYWRDDPVGTIWCRPRVQGRDNISGILSRLPFPPVPDVQHPPIDPADAYWKGMLEEAKVVWDCSPKHKWSTILTDLEYIIPSDDPRVLKRAPPMFLDTSVNVEREKQEELERESEDEFFDAVE